MGHEASNRAGKLLAAVSVLSLSVGMVPAIAAGTTATSNQLKTSSQIKLDCTSTQIKFWSQQQKQNCTQIKGESTQIKLDSTQHKHNLNPQPLPPG